jgi:hypothetical protein
MDIRALLGLWDDLKDNHGLRFLMTERLTQDCIENLFSQIRGNGGHIANPSAAQFRTFIRRAMVDSIIVHKEQSNSKEDAAKFLLSVKDISRRGNTEKESGCILPAERVVVNPAEPDYEEDQDDQTDDEDQIDDDQNELAVPDVEEDEGDEYFHSLMQIAVPCGAPKRPEQLEAERNALTYVAGYIAMRQNRKVCETCYTSLQGPLTGANHQRFLVQKQLDGCSKGLTVPSDSMVAAVRTMQTAFSKNIAHIIHTGNVRKRLTNVMIQELGATLASGPCECPLRDRVVRTFFNMKFHFFFLKEANQSFSQRRQKRNQKVINFSHL